MEEKVHKIISFLKSLNAKGFVVGVSGGVDSAVVLALCNRVMGKKNVLAVMLPCEFTPANDLEDAKNLSDVYGRPILLDLDPLLKAIFRCLPESTAIVRGNLIARLRMVILYYYSNKLNYLVCGTSDKSENFIGYFTKFGDGAVDVEPIIHLTKTEVREIARHLRIPSHIADKPSSPRLMREHEAEKELGFSYDLLDKILSLNNKTEHKRKQPTRMH